ncbi:hypothetical protein C9374_012845 [Naegleria lovaniensis]|uniref:MORN repeat protein n=1 Tax=Naegleria lovaniensis TaxID=51637 RepID=A0AA88KC94_NAELO|nr:uncharacterized protein C9374_012845 [Naegleria lovaniensis]KAG2373113.1 hypothetical protein C9374_012845 [Naegleria lovaniensis]
MSQCNLTQCNSNHHSNVVNQRGEQDIENSFTEKTREGKRSLDLLNDCISENEEFDQTYLQASKKKIKMVPFYLLIAFLDSMFPFLRGKDLNICRQVCKDWYNFQNSDYFISQHTKRMNLIHNKLVISHKKTQISIVQYILGYKQGPMLVIHTDNQVLKLSEKIQDYISKPEAPQLVNDALKEICKGHIKSQLCYKDGKKHGEAIDYFKSGEVMQVGHFAFGKKEGSFVKYFSHRKDAIERSCSYKNDKLDGKLIEYKVMYNENGRKVIAKDVECHYKNGKYDGLKILYFGVDEQVMEWINYKEGKFHGICRSYTCKDRFFNTKEHHLNCEATYFEGKLHGVRTEFYADGSPFQRREYNMGKLVDGSIYSRKRVPTTSSASNSIYVDGSDQEDEEEESDEVE